MATLVSVIVSALVARRNCQENGNNEWYQKWGETLNQLELLLPSGAGIDNGVNIDRHASSRDKLVLATAFHHLDEHGSYDGWTKHEIHVTPAFDGINLRITGPDRNQIKEYLHEVFYHCLTAEYVHPKEPE